MFLGIKESGFMKSKSNFFLIMGNLMTKINLKSAKLSKIITKSKTSKTILINLFNYK